MEYPVHPITLEEMINVSTVCGGIMIGYFDRSETIWKSDDTPLTVADTLINRQVIDWAQKLDSSIDILGEEESVRTDSDWQIMCDPIDGTFPFTWGMPVATFMLTLLYKGQPVRSVIYDPFRKQMYTAEKGKGAFCNGKPIQVSDHGIDDRPVVGYVSWHNCGTNMHAICGELERKGFQLINICSIGYMEAMVARGDFVGTIFPQKKPDSLHDTAAGALLVKEAGGVASDLDALPLKFDTSVTNGHIMSNSPQMSIMLWEVVKEFG